MMLQNTSGLVRLPPKQQSNGDVAMLHLPRGAGEGGRGAGIRPQRF